MPESSLSIWTIMNHKGSMHSNPNWFSFFYFLFFKLKTIQLNENFSISVEFIFSSIYDKYIENGLV